MTGLASVKAALDLLGAYYADKTGQPVTLNDVQRRVYLAALGRFDVAELERACYVWMAKSAWMPKASDLLAILDPPTDAKAEAELAWSAVEQAIRHAGIYRGATFDNGAVGEAVRQVFGTWAQACSFELDSPGWYSRKQAFLAIYGHLRDRAIGPVTLGGLQKLAPFCVGRIPGLPAPKTAALSEGPLSHDESHKALRELADRGLVKMGPRRIEGPK